MIAADVLQDLQRRARALGAEIMSAHGRLNGNDAMRAAGGLIDAAAELLNDDAPTRGARMLTAAMEGADVDSVARTAGISPAVLSQMMAGERMADELESVAIADATGEHALINAWESHAPIRQTLAAVLGAVMHAWRIDDASVSTALTLQIVEAQQQLKES